MTRVRRLLLVASFVILATRDAAAEGLDLVVLVDRSGSMARQPLQPLLELAFDLVLQNAHATGLQHRFGVIGFASSAWMELPLAPVRPSQRERLRMLRGANGQTDVFDAFEMTSRLFGRLPRDAARRRAVLLITDGVPDVSEVDPATYGKRLVHFVDARFRDAPVTVLLLRHTRRNVALWRRLAQGRVHALDHDPRGTAYLAVADLVSTRVVVSEATGRDQIVVVPPYLDRIVFDVLRAAGSGAVQIIAPGGAAHPAATGAGVGESLSTFIVRDPAPGEWLFRGSGSVRVFSQQFFPRGTLVEPAANDTLRQYDRSRLTYRLAGRNGDAVEEVSGSPLTVTLEVVEPDDTLAPMTIERRGSGVFRTIDEAAFDIAGRYWTVVRVTTKDVRGRPVEVLHDRWSGFTVAAAVPIDCDVTTPAVTRLLWSSELPARVECRHPASQRFDLSWVSNDFRPLLLRNDRPASSQLHLRYAGGGVFEGSLRGAAIPGTYNLQLTVDRTRLRDGYNIRLTPRDLSFTRRLRIIDQIAIGIAFVMLVVTVFALRIAKKRRPLLRDFRRSPSLPRDGGGARRQRTG